MRIKEKTLVDLLNDDNFMSSYHMDIEDTLNISSEEIPLSKAFAAYKFALKNPDQLYALNNDDN